MSLSNEYFDIYNQYVKFINNIKREVKFIQKLKTKKKKLLLKKKLKQ